MTAVASPEAQAEAIDRVSRNAHAEWMEAAEIAVMTLARSRPNGFTADDVWSIIDYDGTPPTHERRALGGVMTKLSRTKKIVHTGTFRRSTRRRSNVSVWTLAQGSAVTNAMVAVDPAHLERNPE